VADQEVAVKSGKVVEYKVRLKLTFVLDEKNSALRRRRANVDSRPDMPSNRQQSSGTA
jgi:hypothetical protein